MLKALKNIFRKGEAEQPASITPTPSAPSQPSAPRHSQPKAETPRETKKPRTEKPRRERPAKPVDTWKLEDFVVEPQEGKTRFHDFRLAPELMHAIHAVSYTHLTLPTILLV